MRIGALLDNVPLGATVPDSSIAKLRGMGATAVGTLWTGGSRHGAELYARCERELVRPVYLIRVGGHRQTAMEWLTGYLAVQSQIAGLGIVTTDRAVFIVGNEPNLEGWPNDPEGYGRCYQNIAAQFSAKPAFAYPSTGTDDWLAYARRAIAAVGYRPKAVAVNLYAHNVGLISAIRAELPNALLYVTEVNSYPQVRGAERAAFVRSAFDQFHRAGVKAALVFIAGGTSGGAWDEQYVLTQEEAAGMRWTAPVAPPPQPGVKMNWAEIALYSQWSAARIAKQEDPRGVWAFQEHLKALGADYTDPYRYGMPVSPKP